MRDFFPRGRANGIGKRLLAIDSFLDDTFSRIWRRLDDGWWGVRLAFDRFSVRGWRRGLVELFCEGLTWACVGGIFLYVMAQSAMRETEGDWRSRADLAVTFLDRNGSPIGQRGVLQNDSVPLNEFPDHFIKAVLATEDARFYQHFGIDIPGTFRAVLHNATSSDGLQGGSSITQQTAKNIFLSNQRTLERKVREAFLALWLEFNFSKDEILKLYLDRAYMGGGAFGAEAAAQFYFGKSIRDVSLAEGAMLAGLFKAPTKYAPHIDLPAARARANVVLDRLVESGFMTEGQVHPARLNPAKPVERKGGTSPDYYLDWAFSDVKRMADDGKFGSERVLVVRTPLDPAMQARAEEVVSNTLRQVGKSMRAGQAALVLMDPDGAVRAMIGGQDYGASQFNRATDAQRQPGSSFKVYVYTAAMLSGKYTPTSIVPDAPITIGNWSPQNYGRSYAGSVQLITAFAKSYNTVPVRLTQAVGRKAVADTAHLMGIKSEIRLVAPMALGVSEINVLEHTTGYATLASGGRKAEAYAAVEVKNSKGDVLWARDRDAKPNPVVLPPNVVSYMNTLTRAVVTSGTGGRARLDGIISAGKSGTSQNYRDAWFMGYTGSLVMGVWIGNDDFTPTNRMTGGSLPAQVWHDVMIEAQKLVPVRPIPGIPDDVGPATAKTNAGAAPVAVAVATAPSTLSARTAQLLIDLDQRFRKAAEAKTSALEAAPGAPSAVGADRAAADAAPAASGRDGAG